MVKRLYRLAFLLTGGLLVATVGATSPAASAQEAALLVSGREAPLPASAPEDGRAIDRWLVSAALSAADRREATRRLSEYPPAFPDRDVEVAGVRWTLERLDAGAPGAVSVRFSPAAAGGHRLLHSYLRTDRDRTVALGWRASECGRVALWLNGQRIIPLGPSAAAEGGEGAAASGGVARSDARSVSRTPARLARGWNSLLAAVETEGCPGEVAAWLAPAEGVEPGAEDLADIRVQASRPPGIHRTYPAPWVTIAEQVRPGPLEWSAETRELTATVSLQLVSWGRDPAQPLPEPEPEDEAVPQTDPFLPDREVDLPEDDPAQTPEDTSEEAEEEPTEPKEEPDEDLSPAERVEASWAEIRERLAPPPAPRPPAATTVMVEGRAGGARIRTPVEVPGPATPVTFAVPLTFRELERATAADGVTLDVRWARERWRGTRSVDADAVRARLGQPIPLTGWVAAVEPDRRAQPAAELPAAGEARAGRWQVPPAFGGRALELLTDGAPGRYRVNGRELSGAAGDMAGGESRGRIPLCDPCREGATLVIQVEATGDWTVRPRAVVAPPPR